MDTDAIQRSGDGHSISMATQDISLTTLRVPQGKFDFAERDPTKMNDHVKVMFEEVIAEPEGSHSFRSVWQVSFNTFTESKKWCYRILSAVCAVPCAFCWGIHFATLTFCQVWAVVPTIRSCRIKLHCFRELWSLCIQTVCDPFYDSIARTCSRVRINLHHDGQRAPVTV